MFFGFGAAAQVKRSPYEQSVDFRSCDPSCPPKAQEPRVFSVVGIPLRWATEPKGLNNQCPVCGTMAEKYVPNRQWCGDIATNLPVGKFQAPGCDADERMTRCIRCNNAFYQDKA